jgi:hypothetical protein
MCLFGYKVFAVVNILIVVFWVVTPCGWLQTIVRNIPPPFDPEDGGDMFLRNVCNHPLTVYYLCGPIYLFTYGLFNKAVNSSDYIALNDRIVN